MKKLKYYENPLTDVKKPKIKYLKILWKPVSERRC